MAVGPARQSPPTQRSALHSGAAPGAALHLGAALHPRAAPRAALHPGAAPGASLHPGAVEHYENAVAYEERYAHRLEDIAYYRRKIRGSGHVLEYGAGAGRLTLALASPHRSIVAVDASGSMLARLKERQKEYPAPFHRGIKAVVADMRTFSTKRRFEWVVAGFHTVCHLYSLGDLESFLRRAREHLVPGGHLLFDVPLPRIDMPGYDPIAQVRVMEIAGSSGPELLTQRWYHPQEILMHLHYAGFERCRLTSDFSSEPVSSETSVVCVSARKPRA